MAHMDYDLLISDAASLAEVIATVKEAIAKAAGDGITKDMIDLELFSGSVIVRAVIEPPASMSPGVLQATLEANAAKTRSVLEDQVQGLPGIQAVSTGIVTLSGLSVTLDSGA